MEIEDMTVMDEIEKWRAGMQRKRLAMQLVMWGMAGTFFGGAIVVATWMRYL